MAIGIAVDILGCTVNLEDRAATLNRIIQVAVELKDSLGDLYAFSAIMKALEMPQVKTCFLVFQIVELFGGLFNLIYGISSRLERSSAEKLCH